MSRRIASRAPSKVAADQSCAPTEAASAMKALVEQRLECSHIGQVMRTARRLLEHDHRPPFAAPRRAVPAGLGRERQNSPSAAVEALQDAGGHHAVRQVGDHVGDPVLERPGARVGDAKHRHGSVAADQSPDRGGDTADEEAGT